jgi:hypothetical protein
LTERYSRSLSRAVFFQAAPNSLPSATRQSGHYAGRVDHRYPGPCPSRTLASHDRCQSHGGEAMVETPLARLGKVEVKTRNYTIARCIDPFGMRNTSRANHPDAGTQDEIPHRTHRAVVHRIRTDAVILAGPRPALSSKSRASGARSWACGRRMRCSDASKKFVCRSMPRRNCCSAPHRIARGLQTEGKKNVVQAADVCFRSSNCFSLEAGTAGLKRKPCI